MRVTLCFLILLCAISTSLHSQTFSDVTNSQGIIFSYTGEDYGGGVSFVDFNKDGWDDLSFCQNSTDPPFYVNNNGEFMNAQFYIENSGQMKDILWVDYDNDNDLDIYATRMWGESSLYQNDGLMNFTDVTDAAGLTTSEQYMTTGASFGDYDRDGDLDLYLCNYNGNGFPFPTITNYLYRNNGDGTFTDVSIAAGVDNGSRYSFQGLWMDYNKDLWPDLLVVNDRTNTENYLYHNNGDGTFTDVSAESGIGGYFIFSMNASADDYDNDGDMDVYITNNPFGNLFHRNNGDGTFEEVAENIGVAVYDHTWCAQFFDFDNDTYQDLHVCCSPFWGNPGQNKFFKNNGDGTFSDNIVGAGFQGDQGWNHCSAVGDYNNDGSFDLAISKAAPNMSKLYKGPTTPNSWLKVKLKGILSNIDGIGSWIDAYIEDKQFARFTYCGEGYLSQNSHSEIFGLGSYQFLDSLVVRWPSGMIDRWYHVEANQSLILEEGSSVIANLEVVGNTTICEGESVTISAPEATIYIWNNNSYDQNIIVTEPGTYWCTIINENGITMQSDSVVVQYYPQPDINAFSVEPTCFGFSNGSITLNSSGVSIEDVLWEIGASGLELTGIGAGQYEYVATDTFGCIQSGEVSLSEPEVLEMSLSYTNNLCYGDNIGSASIQATGGTGPYEIIWSEGDGDGLANGFYTVEVQDMNGCLISQEFEITSPSEITLNISTSEASAQFGNGSASVEIQGGIEPYTIVWSNGNEGPIAEDLPAGSYACTVTDANGCSIEQVFEVLFNNVENLSINEISIYPNPFNEFIEIQGISDFDRIYLHNSMGQRIGEFLKEDSSGHWRLDTKSLSSGVYYLTTKRLNNPLVFIGRVVKDTE